jgi:hypothetical protein
MKPGQGSTLPGDVKTASDLKSINPVMSPGNGSTLSGEIDKANNLTSTGINPKLMPGKKSTLISTIVGAKAATVDPAL